MRSWLMHCSWTLAALASCTGQLSVSVVAEDGEAGSLVLAGEELAEELRSSPVRESPEPFARIGVVWDADRPGAIEISMSTDGAAWTEWRAPLVHHVEMEEQASFAGQVEVPGEPARFFRLRSGGEGIATFALVELLTTTHSASIESGEEDGEGVLYARTIGDAEVHERSEWGARSTRCSAGLGNAYRMAIHHTESPTNDSVSPQARLRNIQSYHMDVRGWCDIGYHYLMSRDGRLWEGRPGHLRGAHAGAGHNTGNIGLSVIGSHGSTPITGTQLHSFAGLIRGLCDQHGISTTRSAIKGHREYKSTSCPGNALFAQLDDIVDLARDWNGGGGGGEEEEEEEEEEGGSGDFAVQGVLYAGSDTSERIAGATIRVGGRSTATSPTGYWRFEEMPYGDFTVSAEAAGYQSRSITRTTYAAETWASFGLSPEAAPSGTAILQGVVYITSDSSNRIPHAEIQLSTGHTGTADGNGFYRLTGLPAGDVTITASAPGYAADSVSRSLVDGETSWGSVRLD